MTHTQEYFEKKFLELEEFAKDKGVDFPYKTINQFIRDYGEVSQTSSNVMATMKYNLQYETSYRTALAELRAAREIGDTEVRLRDLKKISTKDFAELYKNEIKFDYNFLRRTKGSAVAASFISNFWFGSE